MEPMEFVSILSRWLHVGWAIVVLGGAAFIRYILIPAAEATLSQEEHDRLREAVMGKWRKVNGMGIGFLLLSGLFNYVALIPAHKGDGLYHAMMGVKMLLALGVFFLASVLVGRSPTFEPLRRDRNRWMVITILLASVVVAIGGFLKVRGPVTSTPAAPEKAETSMSSSIEGDNRMALLAHPPNPVESFRRS
jgi:uncharacterized membrane protein